MAPRTFTIAERPDLEERLDEVADPWPEFIHHDPDVRRWWGQLFERFRDFQLVVYDDEEDVVLGEACSIPIRWDGTVESLPEGVTVLESGFSERAPTVLCALMAAVDARHRGRGLSGLIIRAMADCAHSVGLECLIAPVRPTWKERYPLTPIERYMRWTRADGLPFDPWIRLHHRLGAEILAVAPRSLDVRGTVAEWEEWTGMAFPESGDYIVEGALVPVTIDRERDEGRYVEPNVWMKHELRPLQLAALPTS
jgi:GNAT superfamily N-acetyltransferase